MNDSKLNSNKRKVESQNLDSDEDEQNNSEVDDYVSSGDDEFSTSYDQDLSIALFYHAKDKILEGKIDENSRKKLVNVLGQARNNILSADEDLDNFLTKANKKLAKALPGDRRVPPGSSEVKRNYYTDKRYLLSNILLQMGKIFYLGSEFKHSLSCLKESLIWYPRNCESNFMIGELIKNNAKCDQDWDDAIFYFKRAMETGDILLKECPNKYKKSKLTYPQANDMELSPMDEKTDEMLQEIYYEEIESSKKATQSLILLLCQLSRNREAKVYLQKLGYTYKLSQQLFAYNQQEENDDSLLAFERNSQKLNYSDFVMALDDVFSDKVVSHLQYVFRPESPFWSEHHYDIIMNASASVGYFSYIYPMNERGSICSIEQIIDHLYPLVCNYFPQAKKAVLAEWWVHSRPHANGHQLHFDSDESQIEEEEKGSSAVESLNHPIVSVVVYLTKKRIGGPTLVTTHKDHGEFQSSGWLVHPKLNRVVIFDATFLHGVLPGRGFNPAPYENERRLSFMVGFWEKIRAKPRGMDIAGPGQPFPYQKETSYTWPSEMKTFINDIDVKVETHPKQAIPEFVPAVWEQVDPEGMKSLNKKSPSYKECFQGF